LKRLLKAGKEAILSIVLPLIIIFGIVGGIFTATEAAVVAVVYALIVGIFIHKEIKLKDLPNILIRKESCI